MIFNIFVENLILQKNCSFIVLVQKKDFFFYLLDRLDKTRILKINIKI